MGKAGSPVCRYVDYKCYIWLEREEFNDTKFALSVRKLSTQSVRATEREQTIVQ